MLSTADRLSRMDFKNSGTFGATIAENLVRPPTFELPQPQTLASRTFGSSARVYPSATGPFGAARPNRDDYQRIRDHRFGTELPNVRLASVWGCGISNVGGRTRFSAIVAPNVPEFLKSIRDRRSAVERSTA